jgi:hypothetical protein
MYHANTWKKKIIGLSLKMLKFVDFVSFDQVVASYKGGQQEDWDEKNPK